MSQFKFKQFTIQQDQCAMKVGTDSVFLGAWADLEHKKRILDIGSGTGVLALMTAQRNDNARITAIEIDQLAAEQAQSNINNSPWADRIELIHKDLLAYAGEVEHQGGFDFIITNPPYYPYAKNSKIEDKARSKARTTEVLSFESLIQSVQRLLKKGEGDFALILPVQEGDVFVDKAINAGLVLKMYTALIPRAGKVANRLLLHFCNYSHEKTVRNNLTIRNEGTIYHDYTQESLNLLRAFYTIL